MLQLMDNIDLTLQQMMIS